MNQVLIGINGCFYLIFIILVLVFQFSPGIQNAACKGRASVNTGNAQQTQKAVSIVYATLISFIALLMGVAFLYFGPKMNKEMSNAATKKQKRNKVVRLSRQKNNYPKKGFKVKFSPNQNCHFSLRRKTNLAQFNSTWKFLNFANIFPSYSWLQRLPQLVSFYTAFSPWLWQGSVNQIWFSVLLVWWLQKSLLPFLSWLYP